MIKGKEEGRVRIMNEHMGDGWERSEERRVGKEC